MAAGYSGTPLARKLGISEGARVALLPEWYDVDTGAELTHLAQELRRANKTMAQHTRRSLAALAWSPNGTPGYGQHPGAFEALPL